MGLRSALNVLPAVFESGTFSFQAVFLPQSLSRIAASNPHEDNARSDIIYLK